MNPSKPSPGQNNPPTIVRKVDADQLQHFITTIKTAEQKVGENIINALRHDGTVAVLTTIVLGADGQQRVVSAALNPQMMSDVQELLVGAEKERIREEPCIGFHCLVKPKSNVSHSEDDLPSPDQKE